MFPKLRDVPKFRDILQEFGGYNHNLYVPENQFYNTKNLTSTHYPILSQRQKRGKIQQLTKPNGLFAKEKLAWVDGTELYYDGVLKGAVTDSKKQFVSMGAYLIIFPDKKYYNTSNDTFGNLGNKVETSGTVTFSVVDSNSDSYTYTTAATAPANPTDGQYWLDTSRKPNALKVFSSVSGLWSPIPTTYVKISATGIGAGFSIFDGVTISGCTDSNFNKSFVLYGVSTDYIVVQGIIDTVTSQVGQVTVERVIPDVDYITEMDNRLWGCSSSKHEIYACKQGSPFNWNCFMRISTDSYAATIGTDGDFTGACNHLGYVIFFKENVIHKVHGSKPENYQISDINVRGIQKGSEESARVVNETLYYKSQNDICVYEGGLPASISANFGDTHYTNAVAGALGGKYYVSMQDSSNVWHMFVFDEATRIWHREDNTHVLSFARLENELYYINADDNYIYSVNGSLTYTDTAIEGAILEGNVSWEAESGGLTLSIIDNKYLSRVQLRADVGQGSTFSVSVKYNNSSEWDRVFSIEPEIKKAITIPITPRRCEYFKIKISGTGDFKLYAIAKTYEKGSDVNV